MLIIHSLKSITSGMLGCAETSKIQACAPCEGFHVNSSWIRSVIINLRKFECFVRHTFVEPVVCVPRPALLERGPLRCRAVARLTHTVSVSVPNCEKYPGHCVLGQPVRHTHMTTCLDVGSREKVYFPTILNLQQRFPWFRRAEFETAVSLP